MVASANMWVKFFIAAGVPSAAAATYAHIFYENRMDLDMLTDLNKEYLREMGITPMGDIISILRHSKKVYEQNTRDKILSGEKQSVTASVSPLIASTVSIKQRVRDEDEDMETSSAPSKPPRRVLPEHEGRYKVTLPAGTTERSKQILAKRDMLYADKEKKKTVGIFDRLEQSKPEATRNTQRVKMIGLSKPAASASIFSRLGGKSGDDDVDIEDPSFAGIIKNEPRKLSGIKKMTKPPSKVILVKKIPAKASTMVADEYDARGEKSVKFSTTDEILEIESRRQLIAKQNNRMRLNEAQNVKTRLGLTAKTDQQSAALLHRTKKIIKLKQPVKRANGQILNVSALKSDEVTKSVKSRLLLKKDLTSGKNVKKITDRIGRVSLKSRLGKTMVKNGNSANSVFDRLGFNKK